MNHADYPEYGIYKGLQRPLEFMGLQGRYIVWGACGGLLAFILFVIMFALFGLGIGLLTLIVSLATLILLIAIKQRAGLHDKNRMKGVYITTHLFKIN